MPLAEVIFQLLLFFFFPESNSSWSEQGEGTPGLGLCGPRFNPTRFHSIRKPGSALTIGSRLSEGDFCPIY